MPRIPIHNVGAIGVIADQPSHVLPPEVWSDVRNIRFHNNIAETMGGYANVFSAPSSTPYWAMPAGDISNIIWIYADLTDLFATDGTNHAEITRAVGGDYSTVEEQLWNGGILAGIVVITNGVDDPQQWVPALGNDMADLSNWPAATTCKVIRPFKNFLIALNITQSGSDFPHRVKWSHPAVPGAVPSSWDDSDVTLDAGEFDLSDSQAGVIVDGLPLGDIFIIYKERSVHGMQYIGGQNIFRRYGIFDSPGLLCQGAVTNFARGRQHFLATGEDVIIHNGQELQSVADKKMQHFIFNNLDIDNYARSFVVENPVEKECWFCYPETGANWPNMAFVWNYNEGTTSLRELGNNGIPHIAVGPIPETGANLDWDSDGEAWDDDGEIWDEQTYIPFQTRLLQSNPFDSQLQQLEITNQYNMSNVSKFIERTGIALIGKSRDGQPKVDFGSRKLCTRIWPKVTGGPILVEVGAQEDLGEAVTYAAAQSFDPATQKYLDFTVNGRLLATKFSSTLDVSWQLDGYDLEIEILGQL